MYYFTLKLEEYVLNKEYGPYRIPAYISLAYRCLDKEM